MFKKIILSLILLFSLLSYSYAGNIKLKEVEDYLNNIEYFKSNFIQDDLTSSKLSEGIFYLSRPGKLRLDYLNPFEASLYTYNKTTTYFDKELDEITHIRTTSTPLQFLLRKNISFKNKDFKIIDTREDEKEIIISFKQNGKDEQGTLTLKFKKNPIILTSIKLINELEQEVEINLFNISTEPIKNSVFVFKNPRIKNKILK